jgi:alpha-galactosidase
MFKVPLNTTFIPFCLLLLFSASIPLKAAAQSVVIPIETQNNALVLQTDPNKHLGTIYFGKKLTDNKEYAQVPGLYQQTPDYTGILNSAYTPSGSRNLVEPALSVTHADGNNSLDLKYVSHDLKQIDNNVSLLSLLNSLP